MTARDIVPEPAAPRGFLRRRRTDEPYPHHEVAPPVLPVVPPVVEAATDAFVLEPASAPEAAPPREVDEPDGFEDLLLLAALADCARCAEREESEELFRAQASLLQAALRQADELEAALANERHERREEVARLQADNELLRNALARLNAEALRRPEPVDAPLPRDPFRTVPAQREHEATAPVEIASAEREHPHVTPPDGPRHGRRRSGREAGPA